MRSLSILFSLKERKAVEILIGINLIVFVLIHLFPGIRWIWLFGLLSRSIYSRFMFWQFVTYMFLHLDLWHLVINMLMLWFFGEPIERAWGKREFLKYYFLTGIGAGFCSFLVNWKSPVSVIGASGAIFGILLAYAFLFPESIIVLFFFFPMKAKVAVLVLGVVNLLGALSSSGGGIAYLAQLGGALAGFLYLKKEYLGRRIFYFWRYKLKDLSSGFKFKKSSSGEKKREEVDRILDKISHKGVKSLTRRERQILKNFSSDL